MKEVYQEQMGNLVNKDLKAFKDLLDLWEVLGNEAYRVSQARMESQVKLVCKDRKVMLAVTVILASKALKVLLDHREREGQQARQDQQVFLDCQEQLDYRDLQAKKESQV